MACLNYAMVGSPSVAAQVDLSDLSKKPRSITWIVLWPIPSKGTHQFLRGTKPTKLQTSQKPLIYSQPPATPPEEMVSDKFQDSGQPEMVEEEPETNLLSLPARRGPRSEYLGSFSW